MSLVRFRPEAPFRGFSSFGRAPPCQGGGGGFEPRNPLQKRVRKGRFSYPIFSNCAGIPLPCTIRRHSQAVRQRSAKPSSPVRFRVAPPKIKTNPNGLVLIFGSSTPFRTFRFYATSGSQIRRRARTACEVAARRDFLPEGQTSGWELFCISGKADKWEGFIFISKSLRKVDFCRENCYNNTYYKNVQRSFR